MNSTTQPRSMSEFIEVIRAGLVCARCGRYVGSLGANTYLPPPYPVALDKIGADDEVAALVGFEWHMLNLLRDGRFNIVHPEHEGRCASIREWAADDDDDES